MAVKIGWDSRHTTESPARGVAVLTRWPTSNEGHTMYNVTRQGFHSSTERDKTVTASS